jgi:hypothetical protein
MLVDDLLDRVGVDVNVVILDQGLKAVVIVENSLLVVISYKNLSIRLGKVVIQLVFYGRVV